MTIKRPEASWLAVWGVLVHAQVGRVNYLDVLVSGNRPPLFLDITSELSFTRAMLLPRARE